MPKPQNFTADFGRGFAFGQFPRIASPGVFEKLVCEMHQLLRCGRLGEFLKARIIPKRIEHWDRAGAPIASTCIRATPLKAGLPVEHLVLVATWPKSGSHLRRPGKGGARVGGSRDPPSRTHVPANQCAGRLLESRRRGEVSARAA